MRKVNTIPKPVKDMTNLKYYNIDGKCTATKDHLCRYFEQDPFNRRYQICFYRDENGHCLHAMDEVCRLNGGNGWMDE